MSRHNCGLKERIYNEATNGFEVDILLGGHHVLWSNQDSFSHDKGSNPDPFGAWIRLETIVNLEALQMAFSFRRRHVEFVLELWATGKGELNSIGEDAGNRRPIICHVGLPITINHGAATALHVLKVGTPPRDKPLSITTRLYGRTTVWNLSIRQDCSPEPNGEDLSGSLQTKVLITI